MQYYEDPILGKGRAADDAQKMTSAQRQTIVIPAGKLVYDTDTGVLYYGNGDALGGVPLHTTSTENSFVYGIDKDMSTSSTVATKVVLNHAYDYDGANTALRYHAVDSFAQTPAHSFRSVLRDLANGVDVCTLDVSDSTKKSDGTALTADEKLGKWTSGGVTTLVDFMVRIPITYWRIDHYSVEVDGQTHNHTVWLVSNQEFVDSAPHPWFFTGEGGATLAPQYVSKFRGVLCDSTGTPKAQSDENTPAAYVSANNDMLRSIMGYRPAANISRANMRTGAGRNNADLSNLLFREWLTLMTVIDGGDFNVQNSISFGFANCSSYMYAALRKTGRSAVFGNQTGEIVADETPETGLDLDLLTMKDGGTIWNTSGSRVVSFCWRGIEDPWGGLWEQADGCQKNQDAVADDYSNSGYWVTNDTTKYVSLDTDKGSGQEDEQFPSRGYTGDSIAWVSIPFPKTGGYIKTFDEKSFLCKTTGGSSTTYFGDYFYNDANAGARLVYFGGHANNGAYVGVGYAAVYNGLGNAHASLGCRLSAPATVA